MDRNPLSEAWLTLGAGSNHSQESPRGFVRCLVEATETAPEYLASIRACRQGGWVLFGEGPKVESIHEV